MQMRSNEYASTGGQLIAEVVEEGICVQCGTCVGSCPGGCLVMAGENPLPVLDEASGVCTDCGICLDVCPRRATQFDDLSVRLFGRAPQESEVAGVVDSYWAGQITDEEGRRRAAGGGIVSGLVIHLLESGQVDGVILCGPEPGRPGGVVATVVTNREEMLANAGSHYRLVPINALLRDLTSTGDQRFALVGTGCHISGLRKLQMASPLWRRKIVLAIGLLCGTNHSPLSTGHLMGDMGIEDLERVREFKYRGWGGAGAEAVLDSGEKVEMQQYFGFQMIRLAPLFMVEGCSVCLDYYAEQADVTVGDYQKGTSIAFVRSPSARSAMEGALKQGILDLYQLGAEVLESHHVMYDLKLRRCLTLLEGRRGDGAAVPDYGSRERSADHMWEHPEDREAFLFVRRAMRESAVREWFKRLPYWQQFRLGKLYMGVEPRRQWPGGAERSQTLILEQGWEAFLAR
jgi:coenzyme F420 hydrogenase subunit beta